MIITNPSDRKQQCCRFYGLKMFIMFPVTNVGLLSLFLSYYIDGSGNCAFPVPNICFNSSKRRHTIAWVILYIIRQQKMYYSLYHNITHLVLHNTFCYIICFVICHNIMAYNVLQYFIIKWALTLAIMILHNSSSSVLYTK